MKKLIIIFTISFMLSLSYSQSTNDICVELPLTNGLSFQGDSIALGGVVNYETIVTVVSEYLRIIAADTLGLHIYYDVDQYGLFLGNPLTPQGVNVYKDIVNIAAFDELNVMSDYYRIVDRNQNQYVVYEVGMVNFDSGIDLFFNTPSYVDNQSAVQAGRPTNSVYFNTSNNSYSKVL